MIVGIKGRVEKKDPTHLHILTSSGLIYEVFVSLHCSAAVKESEVKLYTTHIIREDAQLLYGFLDINEKRMFDTLIVGIAVPFNSLSIVLLGFMLRNFFKSKLAVVFCFL